MRYHVTFYKETFHGMDGKGTLEKVQFYYVTKNKRVSFGDVYEEAVKRGHNPLKNLRIEVVE